MIDVALLIARSIKGDAQINATFIASWSVSSNDLGNETGLAGKSGIFFLKKKTEVAWKILPVLNGSIPLDISFINLPIKPLSCAANATPLDKLIEEIVSGIVDPSTPRAGEMFLAALGDIDPVRLKAVGNGLLNSSIPSVKAIGLGLLLDKGDRSALLGLGNGREMGLSSEQMSTLARSVARYRDSDAAAIQSLGTMAGGAEPLRSAAVAALRAIHTRKALPFLAELLNGNSSELRYAAVAGIASFANGLPVQTLENYTSMAFASSNPAVVYANEETRLHFPTVDTFLQDEQKYISFWKNWWAVNKAEIEANK